MAHRRRQVRRTQVRAARQSLNPELEPVTINYGAFCQACIDFLIIAFCVFLLVRGITRLTAKKEEESAAPAPAPEPSAEEKLLTEIRDLLKDKK